MSRIPALGSQPRESGKHERPESSQLHPAVQAQQRIAAR